MSVKLNSTGGGAVTLDSPSTASNYTVTLPSAAGTLATTTGTGSVFTNPTINGFTGDTSAITVGTTQFVKDTSGNIGIGTASPGAKLDVRSNSFTPASTTAAVLIEDKSTWTQGLQFYLNNAGTYNSSRPSGGLGAVNSNEMWLTGGSLATNNTGATSGITAYATSASIYRCGSGAHYWYGDTGLTAGSTYTQTQRMLLDSSGNLGLGVTPSAWDSGYSTIQAGPYGAAFGGRNVANTAYMMSNSVRNGAAWKYINTATAAQFQVENGSFYWFNAPSGTANTAITYSQAMTLDSSGNLWVGAASNPASALLYVNQQGANAAINVVATTAGYSATLIYGQTTRAASTSFDMIGCYANGVAQFRVNGAGTIYATNTVVQSASDIRLKENIKNSLDGLDIITALRPVRFDWKQGYGNDRKNQLGFIAQEVEPVFPDAVDETCRLKDGDDEVYKTVGPGALIPVLVKAIQELSAQNQALEVRLAQLEAK